MNTGEESAAAGPDEAETATLDRPSVRTMGVQLYLLPLLIVALLIGGWMFVHWLLHEDQDPRSLVSGMQEPGRRSWQRAYTLSQLLHDPDHDALKDDEALCRELVALLSRRNSQTVASGPASEEEKEEHARFRVFLCRALGEFRLPHGLPALLAAAQPQPGPHGRAVRAAALEAIAVLAGNIGSDPILSYPPAINTVLDASHDEGEGEVELAATAAYVLGVLGGPQAIERLTQLVDDQRDNVRYNAATGLARRGNLAALDVLLEMLDPAHHAEPRSQESDTVNQRRQMLVTSNGIRAAERLYGTAPPSARQQLSAALQRLSDATDLPAQLRLQAKEASLRLPGQP